MSKVPHDVLTDEEILKEFVKRFQCDAAVLIYLDTNREFGFGRWRNAIGRKWVNNLFKQSKDDLPILINNNNQKIINISLSA